MLSTQEYKGVMDFGSLLKALREKTGLSIKRLAPELDVNYTYLSKLENNKVNPSEELVDRMARYFAYSKEELLLAANKIPEDVLKILRENPTEAIAFLRKEFTGLGNRANERRPTAASRKSNIR
jgi:transcriptional regulator with XRE-family HTH domain